MSLKDIVANDTVILKGWTGIKLGVFEVQYTSPSTIGIMKKDGKTLEFDPETGKQTNTEEGKEKYACSIMVNDGSFVPPRSRKSKKKKA